MNPATEVQRHLRCLSGKKSRSMCIGVEPMKSKSLTDTNRHSDAFGGCFCFWPFSPDA